MLTVGAVVIFFIPVSTVASICTKETLYGKVVFACREKCCGSTPECLPSCLDVICESSEDCDGLTCCNSKCQTSTKCPSKNTALTTIWLSIWITFAVFVIVVLLGMCCCFKQRNSSEDINTDDGDKFSNDANLSESLITVVQ